MKMYKNAGSLRMVGKAWEIRATLRQFANKPMTLQEWLARYERAVKK